MTNKIISISGSQGCGKTSTIAKLGNEYNYAYDSISIPRYVQAQHGAKSLQEILSRTPDEIKTYQIDILEAKLERDSVNMETETERGAMIVERNFADIFAFATQWAKDSNSQDFVEFVAGPYKELCIKYQRQIGYLSIILMPLKTFVAEERRAAEKSRFDIHELILDFNTDTAVCAPWEPCNWFMLDGTDMESTQSLEWRVQHINKEIKARVFKEIDFNWDGV